jgi:hypothetical protein
MLPVPDYMRTMFRHMSGCGDAPTVEAALWILHAASVAPQDLSVWECTRLLCSVMRGMCVGAPFCGDAFPHMCCFEHEEKGCGGVPKLRNVDMLAMSSSGHRDETDPTPASLYVIAEELEGVLHGVMKSLRETGSTDGLQGKNPLCRQLYNSVTHLCAVVSKLYDVILLSHICVSTPGCCRPMPSVPGTHRQSFMVFRMQPLDLARQNTCESLCLTLTPHSTDLTAAMSSLTTTASSPLLPGSSSLDASQLDAKLMPSIMHMQRVLSSVALCRRMGRPITGACRSVRDILMNHWSLRCHYNLTQDSLCSVDFCEDLTPLQLATLKKFTTTILELADSDHRELFAQCLERRVTLTGRECEWMLDMINGLHELLNNFVAAMHTNLQVGNKMAHAYMSYMVTPSLWCYTHRFEVSDRRLTYNTQVNEYLARCQELGKRWAPQPHLYDVKWDEWADKFSNFVSNMLEFNCQLSDCCPPVLGVVRDNNPPVNGRWLLHLMVYNPTANKTHTVEVPLNVALRLARGKVHAYFQDRGMEVPRSLKNVATSRPPAMVQTFEERAFRTMPMQEEGNFVSSTPQQTYW